MSTTPSSEQLPPNMPERRQPHAVRSELTLESSWRPTDRSPVATEAWLRTNGYAPDRRRR